MCRLDRIASLDNPCMLSKTTVSTTIALQRQLEMLCVRLSFEKQLCIWLIIGKTHAPSSKALQLFNAQSFNSLLPGNSPVPSQKTRK
jgi:hypothetical protein